MNIQLGSNTPRWPGGFFLAISLIIQAYFIFFDQLIIKDRYYYKIKYKRIIYACSRLKLNQILKYSKNFYCSKFLFKYIYNTLIEFIILNFYSQLFNIHNIFCSRERKIIFTQNRKFVFSRE